MIEHIADLAVKVAFGPGALFALIVGVFCGLAVWAMASLSYGSTPMQSLWFGIKGFVFGTWAGFTPFAVWSMAVQLWSKNAI